MFAGERRGSPRKHGHQNPHESGRNNRSHDDGAARRAQSAKCKMQSAERKMQSADGVAPAFLFRFCSKIHGSNSKDSAKPNEVF